MSQFLLLSLHSAVPLMRSAHVMGRGATQGTLVTECEATGGYSFWLTVQCLYIGGCLIWGIWLAVATRNVPSAFFESSHITIALFALFFSGVVLVPVDFAVSDNPNATALIRGIGQSFVTACLALILYVPKASFSIVSFKTIVLGLLPRDGPW